MYVMRLVRARADTLPRIMWEWTLAECERMHLYLDVQEYADRKAKLEAELG